MTVSRPAGPPVLVLTGSGEPRAPRRAGLAGSAGPLSEGPLGKEVVAEVSSFPRFPNTLQSGDATFVAEMFIFLKMSLWQLLRENNLVS